MIELFWWPKVQDRLLANVDLAADIAAHIRDKQRAGEADNP